MICSGNHRPHQAFWLQMGYILEHSEKASQNFLKTGMHQRRTNRKGPTNTL